MKRHLPAALIVLHVCGHMDSRAGCAAGRLPNSPPSADTTAASANAARRQCLQQEIRPLQQEILSRQQRLTARYAGDLSPEQIQSGFRTCNSSFNRFSSSYKNWDRLPAFGARGGFGGGRGGRGPITPPADATSEQLRQIVDQQNQQIIRLQACTTQRPAPPPPCVPVNTDATQEARDLLKKICDIGGKGILTGQHNFPNHRNKDTEAIHEATGKYPAIWGSDFGFTNLEDQDAVTHRNLMIEEAKRQYAAGSIIYFCWHMLRPLEDEPGQSRCELGGQRAGQAYGRTVDGADHVRLSPAPALGEVHGYGGGLSEGASRRPYPGPVAADAREQREIFLVGRPAGSVWDRVSGGSSTIGWSTSTS